MCPERRRLLPVLGSAVGGDDREIAFRPAHAWLKLSLTKLLEKVADSIGKINARIQRRSIRYLTVHDHDVAHDETAAWSKSLRDSAEEMRLPRRCEVVDCKRGHNEVERALGERILESSQPQIDIRAKNPRRDAQHSFSRIKSDDLRTGMRIQVPTRRLARACAEVKHSRSVDIDAGVQHLVLEDVVQRQRLPHQV